MAEQDPALAKKAMRGNPKAFGALVRNQQDYLYRMAFQNSRCEQDALDAVQDGILKAYKAIGSLKEPQYFNTWLTRIVINAARDLARKRKPEEGLEAAENLSFPQQLSTEEKMDLYNAIELLPEKYRTLLSLKYFDGLTISEISASTNMPQGTVSVYLSRGLQILRKELT